MARPFSAESATKRSTTGGTVTGSVNLGAGGNAFNNLASGRLISGATVNLGAGNTLENYGTLSPGGGDRVMTTDVTGNLVQAASGKFATDLDVQNAQADRINVSGTSNLEGTVEINLINPGYASPVNAQLTIVSSSGGVDQSNLALSAARSAVVGYALLYPNLTDVALGYSVDFSPAGLGGNQSSIGNYVNAIQRAGGSAEFAPIAALLVSMPDVASLGNAYDQLSPEPLLATATTAVQADLRFSDALHSCRVRDGEFRFVSEGECSWTRLIGSKLDQDRTASNTGFTRKTNTLAAGVQKRVNEHWYAGFGFSIDTSTLHVSDNTRSEGNQYALGLIAKRNAGATAFTASIDVGYGPYDTTRAVNIPVPGAIATSTQKVGLVSAHVRMSHDYMHKNVWYLRPLVDVGVTHVYHGAFDEQGAGAANLSAKSGRDTLVSLQPGVEFGREFATAGGTLIRQFGMLGLTDFVSGTTAGITASLQGAPVGTAPFTTESTMDKTHADLTLGVDTLGLKGTTVRVSYTGQFSDHSEAHSASLKLSMPF
jgi:outer membrane autotransporter protein